MGIGCIDHSPEHQKTRLPVPHTFRHGEDELARGCVIGDVGSIQGQTLARNGQLTSHGIIGGCGAQRPICLQFLMIELDRGRVQFQAFLQHIDKREIFQSDPILVHLDGPVDVCLAGCVIPHLTNKLVMNDLHASRLGRGILLTGDFNGICDSLVTVFAEVLIVGSPLLIKLHREGDDLRALRCDITLQIAEVHDESLGFDVVAVRAYVGRCCGSLGKRSAIDTDGCGVEREIIQALTAQHVGHHNPRQGNLALVDRDAPGELMGRVIVGRRLLDDVRIHLLRRLVIGRRYRSPRFKLDHVLIRRARVARPDGRIRYLSLEGNGVRGRDRPEPVGQDR